VSQNGTKVIIIRKKAKGHPAHHGGAWKVAYADFVTAMMALFIVLWLLTQTDQASRARIAQYFRTGVLPGGSLVHGETAGSNPPMAVNVFTDPVPGRGKETKQLSELTKAVTKMLGQVTQDPSLTGLAEHVEVKMVDDGALIELVDGGDNFLFSLASSELKPSAVLFLERLAPLLGTVPNKIEIHGHTDARPFDRLARKNNWDLSYERANRARIVLSENGLRSGQINAVLAHADSALYNPDKPYAPENRRLSILVVRQSRLAEREGRAPAPAETQDGVGEKGTQ